MKSSRKWEKNGKFRTTKLILKILIKKKDISRNYGKIRDNMKKIQKLHI